MSTFNERDGKGRLSLVIGAAGGIGSKVALKLAATGSTVVAADRQAELIPQHPQINVVDIDATQEASIRRLREFVMRYGENLSYLVNCAGITGNGPLTECSLSNWHHVLDVNLTSCFLLAREFYPMLALARGSVVFCGSSNAVNGGSELSGPAYAAAKAGVHNLVRYLAKEWANDGIRVNAVAPGPIDTPMLAGLNKSTRRRLADSTLTGRFGTASEVSENILFLCSRHAAWQTGSIVNISGGLVL